MDTLKRVDYCILAILIAAVIYGWSLWYYSGLYHAGALLSASGVTAETLLPALYQEWIVVLPEILAAVIAWALLGWKQFPQEMGLKAERGKKRYCLYWQPDTWLCCFEPCWSSNRSRWLFVTNGDITCF